MSEQAQPGLWRSIGCLVVVLAVLAAPVIWFVSMLDDPRRQVAANIHEYADLCSGRPIPGAAAYDPGAGPHPIVVFSADQDDEGGSGIQESFASAGEAEWNPRDPGMVQLVACTERVDDGAEVETCDYGGTPAPMHRSTVEVTVYEARTAEQVGEPARLVAEDLSCPYVVSYRGSPTVFSTPTAEQFRSVLAPLVTG